LPYLIIPVSASGLARTQIRGSDLEAHLETCGAKFVLVLEVESREMRTWDNLGRVEDVATGSAAGPAAAYLLAHGLASTDRPIHLAQGRFAGRPSRITVTSDTAQHLFVSGQVWAVSQGTLDLDPLVPGF
jgi:predicted PhzF superfamily epimerase YddE/YHI9